MLSQEQHKAMCDYLTHTKATKPEIVSGSKLSNEELNVAVETLNNVSEISHDAAEQLRNLERSIFKTAKYRKQKTILCKGRITLRLTCLLMFVLLTPILLSLNVALKDTVITLTLVALSNTAILGAYNLIIKGAYKNDYH